MAFCSQCGSEATGSFCPKCGAAVEGAAGQSAPPSPGTPAASGGLDDNVASALCYLGGVITGIIFLVLAPYNQKKTIRFHAFQSIFVFVGLIVVWIVVGAVFGMILPWVVTTAVMTLLQLACIGLWLYLMWSAYQKKLLVLPVVGPIAEKQA